MRQIFWVVATALSTTIAGACQSEQFEFDAASVKLVDPGVSSRAAAGGPGSNAPGRYSVRTWLSELLKTAYGVSEDQIVGGPAWLRAGSGSNLYEVDTTMPADTTKERFKAMLQTLLVQRFSLVIHHETQDFPAFDLVVAKGQLKLKESPIGVASNAGVGSSAGASTGIPDLDRDGFPVLPPGPHMGRIQSMGNLRYKFQEKSMTDLADVLGFMIYVALGPVSGAKRPRVTDKTGLPGKYDFTIEFACGSCVTAVPAGGFTTPPDGVGGDGPNIFTALEKQLGLKAVKAPDLPLEVLVVDHVDRVPTRN